MSDFKDKMHQIRFPLALRPRPRWGSLQHSPDPLTVFKGPTSKEREGIEGRGRKGDRKKEEGRRGERPYASPVANSWLCHWCQLLYIDCWWPRLSSCRVAESIFYKLLKIRSRPIEFMRLRWSTAMSNHEKNYVWLIALAAFVFCTFHYLLTSRLLGLATAVKACEYLVMHMFD